MSIDDPPPSATTASQPDAASVSAACSTSGHRRLAGVLLEPHGSVQRRDRRRHAGHELVQPPVHDQERAPRALLVQHRTELAGDAVAEPDLDRQVVSKRGDHRASFQDRFDGVSDGNMPGCRRRRTRRSRCRRRPRAVVGDHAQGVQSRSPFGVAGGQEQRGSRSARAAPPRPPARRPIHPSSSVGARPRPAACFGTGADRDLGRARSRGQLVQRRLGQQRHRVASWPWPFPTSISRIGDPASSDSASAHGPSRCALHVPAEHEHGPHARRRHVPDTSLPSGSTTTSRPVSGSNRDPARASARTCAGGHLASASSSTNARSPAIPSGVTDGPLAAHQAQRLDGERWMARTRATGVG